MEVTIWGGNGDRSTLSIRSGLELNQSTSTEGRIWLTGSLWLDPLPDQPAPTPLPIPVSFLDPDRMQEN